MDRYPWRFYPGNHGLTFWFDKDEPTFTVELSVYGDPRCSLGSGELSRQDARQLRDALDGFLGEGLWADPPVETS